MARGAETENRLILPSSLPVTASHLRTEGSPSRRTPPFTVSNFLPSVNWIDASGPLRPLRGVISLPRRPGNGGRGEGPTSVLPSGDREIGPPLIGGLHSRSSL